MMSQTHPRLRNLRQKTESKHIYSWQLKKLRQDMKLNKKQMAEMLKMKITVYKWWESHGVTDGDIFLKYRHFISYLMRWVPVALSMLDGRDCEPDFTL